MKRDNISAKLVPTHDYDQARQKALSWLGDRYLLAEPARKQTDTRHAYFGASAGWYGGSRKPVRAHH